MAWREHIEQVVAHPITGTINCLAVNSKGEISGTTTTSGLSWKIAGRVGDSPIIGAGLFVDNEVGGAGSTGRGEENIKISGGHTIVEMMRRGSSPTDACLEALHRVARNYQAFPERLKQFHIQFYALNKHGEYGAGSLWGKHPNGDRVQLCRPRRNQGPTLAHHAACLTKSAETTEARSCGLALQQVEPSVISGLRPTQIPNESRALAAAELPQPAPRSLLAVDARSRSSNPSRAASRAASSS